MTATLYTQELAWSPAIYIKDDRSCRGKYRILSRATNGVCSSAYKFSSVSQYVIWGPSGNKCIQPVCPKSATLILPRGMQDQQLQPVGAKRCTPFQNANVNLHPNHPDCSQKTDSLNLLLLHIPVVTSVRPFIPN